MITFVVLVLSKGCHYISTHCPSYRKNAAYGIRQQVWHRRFVAPITWPGHTFSDIDVLYKQQLL